MKTKKLLNESKGSKEFWTALGFKAEGTGGGCEAYVLRGLPGCDELLVTDNDASLPGALDQATAIGFYKEAESVFGEEFKSSREALAAALGFTFAEVLKEWLTPMQLQKMKLLNKHETNKGICHSHDFCDANMAMLEAFEKFKLNHFDASDDEHCTLWNAAWSFAAKKFLK